MHSSLRARPHPAAMAIVLGVCFVTPAVTRGHLPAQQGRLISLVEQSDAAVIALVKQSRAGEVQIQVQTAVTGHVKRGVLTVACDAVFPRKSRQIIFLRREDSRWSCAQPKGVLFPVRNADDSKVYTKTLRWIDAILHDPGDRVEALRQCMIQALTASARELRYHAALSLMRLSDSPLSAEHRHQLQKLLDSPATDPAVRVLIRPRLSEESSVP